MTAGVRVRQFIDILFTFFVNHRLSDQYHDSPYRDVPAPAASRHSPSTRQHRDPSASGRSSSTRRSSSRRSRRGSARVKPAPVVHLTSHPTGRSAYIETRSWLLAQHGPVCAYCGRPFKASVMTLDHVAPRRGRTAYDRRDNLVLACPGCNSAKRDLAPIAFLLARRSRAVHLLRYGAHLSPMLVELARSLVPPDADAEAQWDAADDDESPYRD
ncbi:MAG TPA: HNH endonuclease signature motif containing protein [Gemmatimonadaceae bacterium]|nr:HNH endonuclease signature motif containing protein [Gemmatimonadaceae bacterium]